MKMVVYIKLGWTILGALVLIRLIMSNRLKFP